MAAKNMNDIAEVFEKLRFRKKFIGGVDERDVWKQLELLQAEYRAAYESQQERYAALLAEREAVARALKRQLEEGGASRNRP